MLSVTGKASKNEFNPKETKLWHRVTTLNEVRPVPGLRGRKEKEGLEEAEN